MRQIAIAKAARALGGAIVFGISMLGVGCADCIPKSATQPITFAVASTLPRDGAVAHSADELRALIAGVVLAPDKDAPGLAIAGDAETRAAESVRAKRATLEAFITETSFATNDFALVRAGGGDHARLAGQSVDAGAHPRVTLYFTGTCSPCGGGNPGSYYAAVAATSAALGERTELVRVPKGASVEVRECSGPSCPACRNDVP